MTTPTAPSKGAANRKASADPRVIVVMPAYNAARTLEKTYGDLDKNQVYEVILVDDVSSDDTVEVAQHLGLKCIVHIQNRGYGGNQKTCYLEALKDGADVVVMLHPDNQYDATKVPDMVAPILRGQADMVLGSRLLGGRQATLKGGMPIWKYVSNRFLTTCENTAFGTHLSEAHTGFRAYSRRLLQTIPFLINSDDFVFDSEVIAQAVAFGFRIKEVPVATRNFPEASSVNFRRSVIYGLATLNVVRRYLFHKWGVRRYKQFSKRLANVLARHYQGDILK
jgi:glycosyltransferase involved in cell wall biosynthesis